jgi:hypothetical protein
MEKQTQQAVMSMPCNGTLRTLMHPFFYDKHTDRVVTRIPNLSDFAKHTQGMPAVPIVNHLATLL